jgi:cyclomaltodextrinase / maltogenic alpha-amylase / neopullulanase
MNRSAVLHIPMSQYAYGTDEEHIVIRLRAGRGDLTECILHYGDRACRLTPVLFTEQKMAVVAQTEEFDYWDPPPPVPGATVPYVLRFLLCKEPHDDP